MECKEGYKYNKKKNICERVGSEQTSTVINIGTGTGGGKVGFVGLLTLLFIALRLLNVTSWSWWWVLSPVWITFGLGLLLFVVSLITGWFLIRR